MKTTAFFLLLFVALAGPLQAEETPPPPQAEIYNLAQLLGKAERIVVAEAGAAGAEGCVLNVEQVLKEPKPNPKEIDPEVLKRASALLADEKAVLPPLAPKAPPALRVVAVQGQKLPEPGSRAIFFLWDKTASAGKTELLYRLSHPQCVYGPQVLPQVKLGLERPREIADGRYLRDWDHQMAEEAQMRAAGRKLLTAKGGQLTMGLRLKATNSALSLRADNSFACMARLENAEGPEQLVYDGPAGGYGAILCAKGAAPETGIVLYLSAAVMLPQTDSLVVGLDESSDFRSLPSGDSIAKDLFFDVKNFPILKTLQGAYLLKLFFISNHDGKNLDLKILPWTGELLSDAKTISFPKRQ